ncbi:MFS transporter [Staphylococcus simulans]|uniref:MFS transporter n=1 Tax=Staphylococcus simulans TaxID=1286 RepID=UPI0022B36928|nr:MFS transporter [Staphylococcus simulans]
MEFFKFNINVKLRLICSFFTRIFNMATFPFMAIYFASHLSVVLAGVILTVTGILRLIFNLYGGRIADTKNNKQVLIIGMLANGLCLLLIGVFMLSHLPIAIYFVMVFFILNSICSVIYGASLEVLIIEVTNQENRKKVYSYNYWLVNLSLACGITIGGYFFKDYSGVLYFTSGCLVILVSLIYWKFMAYEYKPATKKHQNIFKHYHVVLKDIRYMMFVIVGLLLFSFEFNLTNVISVHLVESHFSANVFWSHLDGLKTIATLQLINTVMVVFLSLIISKFTNKFDIKKAMTVGIVIYTFAYATMLITPHFFLLVVLIIAATIGELVFAPLHQVVQVDLMDADNKGVYSAFASLAIECSALVSSLILLISQYVSINMLYIILIVMIGIILVLLRYVFKKSRNVI